MRKIKFVVFLMLTHFCDGQNSFFERSDSVCKRRVIPVSTSISLGWTAETVGLYQIWYADYPKTKFHLYDDFHNWLQMDKMGHVYSANKLSLGMSDLFYWSGLSKRKSVLIGSTIGLGLQTTLEILDGRSAEWGFSWSDMGANVLGSSSYVIQEILWGEQRFTFKFSYHQTPYASLRPEVLGATFSERFLKDYNGQTYWLSFSPSTFYKSPKIPTWICLSFGYSVDQKIVGDKEVYYSSILNQSYYSSREFILSLDIDFSKLPIKRIWLKTLVKQLNHVKVPFPALVFTNTKIRGVGLYF